MIIAIDPGINSTGLAVLEDKETYLQVHTTAFVKGNRAFTKEEKLLEKQQDSRYVRAIAILTKLQELVNTYPIEAVISEAAFYNPRRPIAYSSLLEVIFAVKYGLIKEIKVPFKTMAPKLVKSLFNQHGASLKDDMSKRLTLLIEKGLLQLDKNIQLTELTEHEIDAIAIGWSYYAEEEINK